MVFYGGISIVLSGHCTSYPKHLADCIQRSCLKKVSLIEDYSTIIANATAGILLETDSDFCVHVSGCWLQAGQ